jgi:hypothetical protein
MPNGVTKASDTADFTTSLSNSENVTEAGVFSTGGWDDNTRLGGNVAPSIVERIPAPVRPSLPASSNSTITRVSPNSYSVTLSLGATLQLSPSFVNALSQDVVAVSPNVFGFIYQTRQRLVATCDATGLLTAVGRGSCSILVGSARTANAPFDGARPPAGLIGCEAYCELQVTVTA